MASAFWQKNIIEGLHKGEEIYFFDIIAIDKQGRRFFAPELKIKIQKGVGWQLSLFHI